MRPWRAFWRLLHSPRIATASRCTNVAAAGDQPRPASAAFFFACVTFAGVALASPSAGAEEIERHLATMGTRLEVLVEAATRARALAASERAVEAVTAVELRLSTWRSDSELAGLNQAAAGRPHVLSPGLATDLARARELWRASGGAFDPAIGALVSVWDLRGAGRVPTAEEVAAAEAESGMQLLALEGRVARRASSGLRLDEGGFGKGVALDEAAAAAIAAGATCVRLDFGGQVLVAGICRPVAVAVADPRDRSATVLELALSGGSLATSGNSERGRRHGGTVIGHILDPRVGRPARDFGSVTVWAANATTADALATALFVMGPVVGMEWQTKHRACEVAYLVRRGDALQLLASPGMSALLSPATGAPDETDPGQRIGTRATL